MVFIDNSYLLFNCSGEPPSQPPAQPPTQFQPGAPVDTPIFNGFSPPGQSPVDIAFAGDTSYETIAATPNGNQIYRHDSIASTIHTPTSSSSNGRYSHKDWDKMRPCIEYLYLDQEKSVNHIMNVMKSSHGFDASARQYRLHISRWGLLKYLPETHKRKIHEILQRREQQGKQTLVFFQGRLIKTARLERLMREYPASAPADPAGHTPDDIKYYTPQSQDEHPQQRLPVARQRWPTTTSIPIRVPNRRPTIQQVAMGVHDQPSPSFFRDPMQFEVTQRDFNISQEAVPAWPNMQYLADVPFDTMHSPTQSFSSNEGDAMDVDADDVIVPYEHITIGGQAEHILYKLPTETLDSFYALAYSKKHDDFLMTTIEALLEITPMHIYEKALQQLQDDFQRLAIWFVEQGNANMIRFMYQVSLISDKCSKEQLVFTAVINGQTAILHEIAFQRSRKVFNWRLILNKAALVRRSYADHGMRTAYTVFDIIFTPKKIQNRGKSALYFATCLLLEKRIRDMHVFGLVGNNCTPDESGTMLHVLAPFLSDDADRVFATAKVLVECGADVYATNSQGYTCLDIITTLNDSVLAAPLLHLLIKSRNRGSL